MIPADLMALLRCPQTGQRLTWAGPELLARINARVANAGANGDSTTDERSSTNVFQAALVREDRAVAYPVLECIPVLLTERAIPL